MADNANPVALVESLKSTLVEINALIVTSEESLCSAYQRLVALVDEHRAALVDETTANLRAGVLDTICRLAPDVKRTAFSSAWQAFKRAPEAFKAAKAVRRFAQIVSEFKDGKTPEQRKAEREKAEAEAKAQREKAEAQAQAEAEAEKTPVRVLEHLTEIVRKAASAGIPVNVVAHIVNIAYTGSRPTAQPSQPEAEAPSQPEAPSQAPKPSKPRKAQAEAAEQPEAVAA